MFTTSKSFAKSELHLHRRHSTVIHELSSSMMLLTTYHDFAAEKPSAFVSPAKRLVLVCLLDMQLWAIAPMVAVRTEAGGRKQASARQDEAKHSIDVSMAYVCVKRSSSGCVWVCISKRRISSTGIPRHVSGLFCTWPTTRCIVCGPVPHKCQ